MNHCPYQWNTPCLVESYTDIFYYYLINLMFITYPSNKIMINLKLRMTTSFPPFPPPSLFTTTKNFVHNGHSGNNWQLIKKWYGIKFPSWFHLGHFHMNLKENRSFWVILIWSFVCGCGCFNLCGHFKLCFWKWYFSLLVMRMWFWIKQII